MQMQPQAAAPHPRPCVPTGYRFTPTPEELIRHYLNPWVTAGTDSFSPGVVSVADIYAADPDALTSRFPHAGHDGTWYFLCVARWKNGGGKAAGSGTRRSLNRCVQGGGTWHGSSRRRPVGREGFRMGFEYRAAGNAKTVWIMEEFVTNLKEATSAEGVKVICKVYHSPRAAAAALDHSEEETDKIAVGSKRPYYDVEGSSYIANAGVSKRARLDDEYAYSIPAAAPSPAEYDYAGTSHQAAPANTWNCQQSKIEQQGTGCKPVPLDTAEGLAVPPMDYGGLVDVIDLDSELNEWLQAKGTYGNFFFGGVQGGNVPMAAT